jgi:polyhydroxybutyrate depolymerase
VKTLISFAVSMLLLLPVQPASALPRHVTWKIDGVRRQALVFEPTGGSAQDSHPLVFVFHGHGGNISGFARKANLHDLWPQAIVVYPQGLPTSNRRDPQGDRPGWQRLVGDDGDRDLKFFDTMLTTLRANHHVDNGRIYATGFSNGANFSFLLWSARSDVFSGFVIVAGALDPQQILAAPKPVLQIAGRQDPLVTPTKAELAIAGERHVNQANDPGQSCGDNCTLFHGVKADVKTFWHSGGHVYPPIAAGMTVTFLKSLQAASNDRAGQ